MSDNTTVVLGTSATFGPTSGLVSLSSYIVNGTATFINRGAAADVWLVETPELKYISKTLRLSPDCFPISRAGVEGDEGSTQPNDPVQQFIQDFRFKAAQWAALQHHNIVKVFGLGERLDLGVEYCENGTARQYLEKHDGDQHKKKSMIGDILEGMVYLHTQDPAIAHGSLTADKVFMAADGTAKIGEFGLSAITRNFALFAPAISQAGLSRWMSPELVNIDPDVGILIPTTDSDIWALGCTFMEILSGEIPYKQYKHELRVRRAIIQGEKPWSTISSTGEEFSAMWQALEWCWESSPGSRPSALVIQQAIQLLGGSIAGGSTTGCLTLEDLSPAVTLSRPPSHPVEPYSIPGAVEDSVAQSLPTRVYSLVP